MASNADLLQIVRRIAAMDHQQAQYRELARPLPHKGAAKAELHRQASEVDQEMMSEFVALRRLAREPYCGPIGGAS